MVLYANVNQCQGGIQLTCPHINVLGPLLVPFLGCANAERSTDRKLSRQAVISR